ncbi:Thiosulfate sulfurtransferase/rhodanese-like domain-containing protein 3, partial [Coemansia sp. RSA 788]
MSTNAKQLELKDILEISSSGKLGDKDMVILDVRRPDEFGSGHVKNAKNVPVQELGQALQLTPSEFEAKYGFKLPANDSQTGVAVHCMR